MNETETDESHYIDNNDLATDLITTALTHPIDYVRVLMQLGHEPIPPQETTFFGRPAMILPNGIEYLSYIQETEGYSGCFRGLSARVLGLIVSNQLTFSVIKLCRLDLPEVYDPPPIFDGDPNPNDYFKFFRRIVILHTADLLVSYPFAVVSVRMMASVIGKEEHYFTLIGAIQSVYKDDGILGFYHGIVPQFLADLILIAASGFLGYYTHKYLVKNKYLRMCNLIMLPIVLTPITNPLEMVSTCMAVTGSSLEAGNPPLMPVYPSWPLCFTHMMRSNQLMRGSILFFRYVNSPIITEEFDNEL